MGILFGVDGEEKKGPAVMAHIARPRGATPRLRSGVVAGRSYPLPKARGGGKEEQAHVQGAVAARAQDGLEELFHVQGQEERQ